MCTPWFSTWCFQLVFPPIQWQAIQSYSSSSSIQTNTYSPILRLPVHRHLPECISLVFCGKDGKGRDCSSSKEWPEPVLLSYLGLAGSSPPVDSTTLLKDHWSSWGWGFPPDWTISQNCVCKCFYFPLAPNWNTFLFKIYFSKLQNVFL